MPWGMLSRGKLETADWTGFIDEGAKLEGTFEFPGTFRLNCRVKGTLISEQSLILGERAEVDGRIDGNVVVISGKFEGIIVARSRVQLESTAVVGGEVHTPCLVMEPGAVFDGKCHMLSDASDRVPVTVPVRCVPQS
jgi:cytoskeletal protein CcmA (bactofilin family)